MRKSKILEKIIDIIYPRRCFVCHKVSASKARDHVCEGCRGRLKYVSEPWCFKCGKPLEYDTELCRTCGSTVRHFDGGVALFVYDDVMRRSISMYKSGGRAEYGEYYAEGLIEKYGSIYRSWNIECVIAVPLSERKLQKRGYNQSLIIAKKIAEYLAVPVSDSIILKKTDSEQKLLGRKDREKNSKRSFILAENIVQLSCVLIVDDVFTTGSTVNCISELLKQGGCKSVYFTAVCIGSEAET